MSAQIKRLSFLLTDVEHDAPRRVLRLSGHCDESIDGTPAHMHGIKAQASGAVADRVIEALQAKRQARGFDAWKDGELTLTVTGTWRFEGTEIQPGRRARQIKLFTFIIDHAEIVDSGADMPDSVRDFISWARRMIDEARSRANASKCDDGAIEIGWTVPSLHLTDERPRAYISLSTYPLGPDRHHQWSAYTIDLAITKARADIENWIAESIEIHG